jgi:hypothetical protein
MITEIKWINGDLNSIDVMTKVNTYNILRNLIDMNTINLNTKEWVERGQVVGEKLSECRMALVKRRI